MAWTALTNMKRLKEIVVILLRYGFRDVAQRLDLPGVSAGEEGADHGHLTTWSRIRHALEDLGPTFVKFGQIMSQRPDLLPADLVAELAKLQDQVRPEPFDQVRRSLEKALGRRVEEVFSEIDQIPLASASMSQVHRAVRADDGRVVAVKIRRAGITAKVTSDLDLLAALAHRLHENVEELRLYDIPRVVENTRYTMLRELDFSREGRNLRIARANLASDPGVAVPKVHPDLTGHAVLTMELVQGRRLTELDGLAPEQGRDMARAGLRSVVTQILHHGFFHADPHPGNLMLLDDGRVCFLDWGMVGRLMSRDRNQLVDFIKAAVDRDAEWFTESLMGFVDHPPQVDRRGLETELADMLESYYALDLDQVDLGGFLTEVAETLRRHSLGVPSSFAVMIKALVTAEGTARRLYPGLNVAAEAEPLIRDLALERSKPGALWRRFRTFFRHLADFGEELPRRAVSLGEKLEQGQLSIGFEHKNLQGLIDSLEGSTNRLTLGLIIAAMLIASSLIITTGLKPHLFGFPALGVIGYSISGVLGLWLMITIIRSRRF